jgi:hypothetical protein
MDVSPSHFLSPVSGHFCNSPAVTVVLEISPVVVVELVMKDTTWA